MMEWSTKRIYSEKVIYADNLYYNTHLLILFDPVHFMGSVASAYLSISVFKPTL